MHQKRAGVQYNKDISIAYLFAEISGIKSWQKLIFNKKNAILRSSNSKKVLWFCQILTKTLYRNLYCDVSLICNIIS